MDITYKKQQFGTVILVSMAIAVVIDLGVAAFLISRGVTGVDVPLALTFCILLLVAWLFSTLTVEVDEREMRWYFGPRLWTHRLDLTQVESVRPVKNHWWYGWGIRMTPHGWLFNVTGFDAIEIQRKDGKKRRIGTPEPDRLVAAIDDAISASGVD